MTRERREGRMGKRLGDEKRRDDGHDWKRDDF